MDHLYPLESQNEDVLTVKWMPVGLNGVLFCRDLLELDLLT